MKNEQLKKTLKLCAVVVAIGAVVALCIVLVPHLVKLQNLKGEELNAALENVDTYLKKFGILRYVAMILLQILQMILAIIPGAPVAVMMGFMFGALGGTILTVISTALGTALIVWCVNKFGMKFVNKFINSKKFEQLTFLHDSSKRDSLLFLLLMIPGTPKDLITFFAPFTGIKAPNLIVLASLARIPSIFLMVYLGWNISDGNLVGVLGVTAVAAVIGLVGILVNDKVMPKRKAGKLLKNKDTVIFDLDGTLLDTLDDLTSSVNFALESAQMPLKSREQVRSYVGNGMRQLITLAVPDGEKNPKFDSVFSTFKSHYAEHCMDKTVLYDGVDKLLSTLANDGYKIAVVSNKAQFAVDTLKDRYFKETITVSIGQVDNIPKKPAPDCVYLAVERLGSTVERSVYVGDSEVDICTAQNAGMDCISVTWGFRNRHFLEQNGATLLVDSPTDMISVLQSKQ